MCRAYPVGVQLRLFPFIEFWVRKGILDFKTHRAYRLFCFKMFYPPKGAAKAEPKVVQLFLLMFYPPKGDT